MAIRVKNTPGLEKLRKEVEEFADEFNRKMGGKSAPDNTNKQKSITQIKIFADHQYGTDVIEDEVNAFLEDNAGKIIFKDIKCNDRMVIVVYDLIEE